MTWVETDSPELREMDQRLTRVILNQEWRKPTHGTCCTCQRCGRPNDRGGGGCDSGNCCNPHEDIDTVLTMIEVVYDKWGLRFHYRRLRNGRHEAWFASADKLGWETTANEETMELAVCRALMHWLPEIETTV